MAGMMTDYSFEEDFKKKFQSLDKLNKELTVISQLIESLKNTGIKEDKDKRKKLIDRKSIKLDELQRVGRGIGYMSSIGGLIEIYTSGLFIVADFCVIYIQLRSGRRVERGDFRLVHEKIKGLMESKAGVKRFICEDEILGFLNYIGLSEADYRPALEKWLEVFFEEDSLINKLPIGSVYSINRIYDKFFYLCKTKFNVSLVHIRSELETVMNREMSSLLVEDYQWFGLYAFVVYKVLDRFLRPLSHFEEIGEFESAVQLHAVENINNINIMDTLKEFAEQVALLQEESNNVLRDIPNKLSFAKGLKFFQEMRQDSDGFIESLSSFVRESPWFTKQRLFLGLSERNVISLLDMMRQKVVLSLGEKASLVSRSDFMSPEWCKTYLSYYYKSIKERINSFFVFEEAVEETSDLQIFLDYLSCDKLHKVVSVCLSQLFFAIQPIADLQNSLSSFKEHLLIEKIPYTEELFLSFIDEKDKELAIIEDKNKLFEDGFLFFNQINDTVPLLCFLSVEKRKAIDELQEKWKDQCELLEKECINDKQAPSKNPINEIEALPFSEPLQKPSLLAELFPDLKARLRELSANILVSLVCIEERAHDYKKTTKNNKLIDRFKSASGQVYATVWSLKKFLNIEFDVTMTALLPKIIVRIETDYEENQSCLGVNLLKNDIARCSESIQSMVDKVKELKDKLIELKQEKEVLMLGKTDENFSFTTIKKMAKIVGRYEQLKDQFLFLYNLMRIVSVDDQLKRKGLEVTALYELFDDLATFKKTYRTLEKHRHLLDNVADSRETLVEKAMESATKQDDSIEEQPQLTPKESALDVELSYETSACYEVHQPLNHGFEHWKNQVEVEINQVTRAIMNASDELLDRLYPLFVRILQHYQQKIEAKQSECLEGSSCIAQAKLYCELTCFEIGRWLSYMDCRLYYFSSVYPLANVAAEGNNRPYLFFQNNYGAMDSVDSANMADYLVATMNESDIEKQIAVEEERLFNHSQSFIKPLCQNDSLYADGFAGLDKRVFEASEQMFKVSQLKTRLEFEKEKKQAVFEQLAKKMDKQSLKSFIKRVDPRANFEFVSTPVVVYVPVVTSAGLYQLPSTSSSVVDSGYSSHAYSFGGTPPP